MIDYFKENPQAFHRYLYHDIQWHNAKALVNAEPLRVKERTRLAINSIKGKDFV